MTAEALPAIEEAQAAVLSPAVIISLEDVRVRKIEEEMDRLKAERQPLYSFIDERIERDRLDNTYGLLDPFGE